MKCSSKYSHYIEAIEKARKLEYQFLRLCDFKEMDACKK